MPNAMGLAAIVAVVLNVAVLAQATDETREPSARYRVEMDGKTYAVNEGESLKLTGTFNNPTVTIYDEPYREFSYGGVSFLYPRSFSFEAELKRPGHKNWTLSGKEFKIIYFLFSTNVTADHFADNLADRFGKQNCKTSRITFELTGQKIEGTRLEVALGGKLTMDIYRLPSGGQTKLLVFQDIPDNSGQPSQEGRDALSLLKKSLAVK